MVGFIFVNNPHFCPPLPSLLHGCCSFPIMPPPRTLAGWASHWGDFPLAVEQPER